MDFQVRLNTWRHLLALRVKVRAQISRSVSSQLDETIPSQAIGKFSSMFRPIRVNIVDAARGMS